MLPFADLEAYANAAILNQLSNVLVKIGGATVPGVFRQPASVVHLGPGATDTSPMVTVASSAVMESPVDQTIEIAGVPFVIGAAASDGTGLTMLTVERVQ
ncbi:head-tail joining protein [Massilia aerilata]|uniref:Uncharacterized protein n=1 Tax=Massilia aerilata TaxID=453817 RepID=A0ABW0RVX7_9BURK